MPALRTTIHPPTFQTAYSPNLGGENRQYLALRPVSREAVGRLFGSHSRHKESLMTRTPFTMTACRTSVLVAAIAPVKLNRGCENNCAGIGLARVLPETATISVGQQFLPEYQTGGGCVGGSISGADYHTTPTRWNTPDTAVVGVDSLTGMITGRRAGDAAYRHTLPLGLPFWSMCGDESHSPHLSLQADDRLRAGIRRERRLSDDRRSTGMTPQSR